MKEKLKTISKFIYHALFWLFIMGTINLSFQLINAADDLLCSLGFVLFVAIIGTIVAYIHTITTKQ